MFDYMLAVLNDTIDQRVHNDLMDFHVKTCNRVDKKINPFNFNRTLLTDGQNRMLEWSEHRFGNVKRELRNDEILHSFHRVPSSSGFSACSPLSGDVFSALINSCYGAHRSGERIIMPYPSGGALYSGQVIIYVKNISNFQPGAYHFLPLSGEIESLSALSIKVVEESLFIGKNDKFSDYDFFILYGSVITKHAAKYGYRGYRLAMLEIGSMYRNMEIACNTLELDNRVWGGFNDEALTVALGLDPRVILPVVCQLVGRS
ncbi:SagB/ThcOx family dehydrogenase [Brenneria izadpanahii]|uniref:SagB/ThcOx family dehydrogenase n=1 Tax=Brenneria izadpanahii TaxID=2722756 RepID=A0ABX7UZ69_9GAMM|nr:SagB/ThcOx family dehydrogenase [Brenneria izadpanahii]QTF08943.1 SagB/ThcOx family dehydrogenase [Brenneria izadpanahii]